MGRPLSKLIVCTALLLLTPAAVFGQSQAANGNIEFVKDFLVPALWTNAGGGDWGTISNWNSDNPTYNGTIQSGPAPRLPNNASLDWVKLQNPSGGTVTLSSGAAYRRWCASRTAGSSRPRAARSRGTWR